MTKEWIRYKDTILKLYKDQGMTLDEVRRVMRVEHGFEASVRAYRSRFDKWRVNKYNIARRRSATATMAARYEPAARAGDFSAVDCFQVPGVQGSELPWARHYSAPDLPVAESDASPLYPQHAVQPQISPDFHTDDMSPVSSTFGHDPAEQPYRTVAVPDHQHLKALVHRLARHDDNRIGTIPEQTILGGGGQLPCHGQDSSRAPGYTALELIVPALRVPLQLGQLEVLLRCLHEAPDVRQPLATTGCPPLSRLADLFFEHLSSRGRRDAAGVGAGDDVLRAVNECFGHLIDRGADPDVLVGGRPLLFRLLGAPAETGAFGPMWESVQRLARLALPVVQQQQQPQQHQQHQKQEGYRHSGPTKAPPNALHALLEGASSSSPPSSASAAATPSEAQNRAYLMTAVLIPRLAALGRLDDRGGAQGLSAFELYVRGGLAAAGDDMGHFLHVSAEFVRHGAGAGAAVVPPAFAGDVQAAYRTGVLGARLQQGRQGAGPLWASVWVSACRLSLVGADGAVVDDHLALLEYITKGRARAEACRSMLPRPPSLSQLQPVDLASPGTGSDGSEEGSYPW